MLGHGPLDPPASVVSNAPPPSFYKSPVAPLLLSNALQHVDGYYLSRFNRFGLSDKGGFFVGLNNSDGDTNTTTFPWPAFSNFTPDQELFI